MEIGNTKHVCENNHSPYHLVLVYTQDHRGNDRVWKVDKDRFTVYRCPYCGAMYLL